MQGAVIHSWDGGAHLPEVREGALPSTVCLPGRLKSIPTPPQELSPGERQA